MSGQQRKATTALWVFVVAIIAAVLVGYLFGKEMAVRDNAASAMEGGQ